MRYNVKNGILLFIFVFIFNIPTFSATMSTYCTIPPFLRGNVPSNLMFVLDYSGSMSWSAYFPYQSDNPLQYYDSSKTYYGYFIPNVNYVKNRNGIWVKTDSTGECQVSCYSAINNSDQPVTICYAKGVCSGSALNFIYMTRVDILRWILTGGEMVGSYCKQEKSCDAFSLRQCKQDNYHDNMCEIDWFIWEYCSNSSYCGDFATQSQCAEDNYHDNMCSWVPAEYIETSNGAKIKIQDVSTYNPADGQVEGLLQQLQKNPNRPRIAVMIFGDEVYDNTVFSSDYNKAIRKINKIIPYGGTATKDAMNIAKSVFADNLFYTTQYGNPYKIDGKTIPCIKNFIILISDGEWNEPDTSEKSDPVPIIDDMWKGGNADLVREIPGNQKVETFTVSAFMGSTEGKNALNWMAVYGNYRDLNGNGYPCSMSSYPDTSLTTTENLEGTCQEVRPNAYGTGPYGYFEGSNALTLKSAISSAVNEVIKKVSSSTAASVVSTNEKSGANILQAVFWAKRYFDDGTSADWVGSLYNLWLYLGYYANSQEIRENSDTANETSAVKYLTLNDKVVKFYNDSGTVKVEVCDDKSGNGNLTNCTKGYSIDDIKSIWNAGLKLWKTNPDSRYIFTDVPCPDVGNEGNFVDSNASCLMSYLNVDSVDEAKKIIDWVRGYHVDGFRSRVVTIDGETHVWKLGDIVDSTPKVISTMPADSYYEKYGDVSYYNYNYDSNGDSRHADRGMVFVGANDGMLHAFRLGALAYPGGNVLAEIKENGGPLGSEAWAFIPKNVLPYLQYIVRNDYCHVYTVDLTPLVVDVAIGGSPSDKKTTNSWRTILIGGMNLGGATGSTSSQAIQSPTSDLGYSSYFAMDITDTNHPKVLWDFTDKDLGFTTTGVDIVHIPYDNNNSKNGYWYAVFASGPDNYNGTIHHPLYLYVLNLANGRLLAKIQVSGAGEPVPETYAFAGRMFTASMDVGENYSDDVLYFGYTYQDSSGNWHGGVLRVNTNDNPNPNSWTVSRLIDGIGPVTAGTVALEDRDHPSLWVLFGTGRYFYKSDDLTVQRRFYGVKDPCYSNGSITLGCTTTLSLSGLVNVTDDANANIPSHGWYINLRKPTGTYGAERVITDPAVTNSGDVVFATFMPTGDICGMGGLTHVWIVYYDNGGKANDLNGKLFMQSSTGEIAEINEKIDFTGSNTYGGRCSSKTIQGNPPMSGGLTNVSSPTAVEENLIWQEK